MNDWEIDLVIDRVTDWEIDWVLEIDWVTERASLLRVTCSVRCHGRLDNDISLVSLNVQRHLGLSGNDLAKSVGPEGC